MREILFRGKRIDNGKWVEGYYYRSVGRDIIAASCDHIVDPSTVGQYTGLTDKNGKKIFEGDILAVEQISDSIEHFESPVKCPYNVVVKWDKCSWMWETIGTARKRYLHFPEAWLFRKCEVIGNIHDNPELLEG